MFYGDPFTCQREKEDNKAERFQILHFHGSFSNNIMAVKGLMSADAKEHTRDNL